MPSFINNISSIIGMVCGPGGIMVMVAERSIRMQADASEMAVRLRPWALFQPQRCVSPSKMVTEATQKLISFPSQVVAMKEGSSPREGATILNEYGEDNNNRAVSRDGFAQEGMEADISGHHSQLPPAKGEDRVTGFLPSDSVGSSESQQV